MTTTLIIHIILAIITTFSLCAAVARIAWKKPARTPLLATWISFGLTALSGIYLILLTPQALTHTCLILSAYVVALSAAHIYSRRAAIV